jgi:hypothetical protein
MASRPQPFRVGLSVVVLAAAVAVGASLWLTRSDPSSGGASSRSAPPPEVEDFPSDPSSGGASSRAAPPPEVEDLPSAGPVADRSPVIQSACDRAGYGTESSDGSGVSELKVSMRAATARHRNDAGSYEFLASPTWNLQEQGPISKLIGPDRDFVVSLGPGPVGGLPQAYDEFVELVGKTYGDVRLGKIDAGCAAGDISVWLHGEGTNADAAPFEFLAVIIERSSGGTVGAFGAWNPKTPQARPLVLEVMQSFQAVPVRA